MTVPPPQVPSSSKLETVDKQATSFFEFWPSWLMYFPVVLMWLILAIRYRSLTLPLLANPKLTLAGMVGVAKSELMSQGGDVCDFYILPWYKYKVTNETAQAQAGVWLEKLASNGLTLPFVCKPDIGCRGSGVKLVESRMQLEKIIASYPQNSPLLAQKLASYEPEVGIFYVKKPKQTMGEIVSLTFKDSPYVTGDGVRTLRQLVEADARAKNLQHLYKQRLSDRWDSVLAEGEILRLVFSASHCRGAVFTDARKHITDDLSKLIESIMADLPDFNYGRLDVKFENLEKLKRGLSLQIVEINGASAESIHIWDKNAGFFDAIKTLMWQYYTLFKLGAYQRTRGYKTPGIKRLIKHWLIERNLAKYYPYTD